jgi:CMP/dCMP kinase
MKHFVIALDGPAGAGKSTIAKRVATELGFLYVDTGAMYRALTLKALRNGTPLDDSSRLVTMARQTALVLEQAADGCRVILDGIDVSSGIRAEEVSRNSHYIAATLAIREIMWEMQRRYRETYDICMEGRDIGSVVFPDAQLKVYLDASVEERARRRCLQLREVGENPDTGEIRRQIAARDRRDTERAVAPLVRLPDAVYVDSTGMSIEDEVRLIVALYRQRAKELPQS